MTVVLALDLLYLQYHIFMLLSACAYISTGRKPAPNSEMCLIATKLERAISKYACAHVVSTFSIKGRGQLLDRTIICPTARCLDYKGAYLVKDSVPPRLPLPQALQVPGVPCLPPPPNPNPHPPSPSLCGGYIGSIIMPHGYAAPGVYVSIGSICLTDMLPQEGGGWCISAPYASWIC